MPWCDTCDRLVDEDDLVAEACPTCGDRARRARAPARHVAAPPARRRDGDLPRLAVRPGHPVAVAPRVSRRSPARRRAAVTSPRMPIYALGDVAPSIHPDAFVHPDAVVIGDVTIGARSSVWPCAVLRGDYGTILVGDETVHPGRDRGPRGARCSRRSSARAASSGTSRTSRAARSRTSRSRAPGRSSCTAPSSARGRRSGRTRSSRTAAWSRPAPSRSACPPSVTEGRSDVELIRLSAAQYVANAARFLDELRLLGPRCRRLREDVDGARDDEQCDHE